MISQTTRCQKLSFLLVVTIKLLIGIVRSTHSAAKVDGVPKAMRAVAAALLGAVALAVHVVVPPHGDEVRLPDCGSRLAYRGQQPSSPRMSNVSPSHRNEMV